MLAGPRVKRSQALSEYDKQCIALTGKTDPDAAEVLATRSEPEPEIWPDHEVPLAIFGAMATQWRVGFGGPYGLDLTALPIVERRLGITRTQAREAFADLQVMEAAGLEWFAEQQPKT